MKVAVRRVRQFWTASLPGMCMNEVKKIMEWKKVIGPGGAALVGLLLVCMAAVPAGVEEGPVAEG